MQEFKPIETIEHLENFINDATLTFLYISRPNCSVCLSLLPQIESILSRYPLIKKGYVNTEELPNVASQFSIFTVPVLILFVSGKEYLREARIVQLDLFEEKIKKVYHHFI